MTHLRTCLAVGMLWCLGACTWFEGDRHVLVSSDPAGAEILIDGEPSGQTTPAKLDLGGFWGSDHLITLRKEGFDDETREVIHHNDGYTSKWGDGADIVVIDFPFWWTLGDFFTPFAVRSVYIPHELHVKLYPEGEGPVHSDG